MAAYILIENGTVTFSDEVLAAFPEITGTVTGNVVRFSNVWREDLISVIGDNVFWAEEQPFASYSITFTDNKASVDTLPDLLVRYINYHDEDFEISLPKYSSNISILYDPLGLGVRPNYYAELQKYVDGDTTLHKLADVIYTMYVVVLPYYDGRFGGIDQIATRIASVPVEDIDKFLNSDLRATPLYEAVRDNSNPGTSGNKSYSLQTSSKEFVFTENSGSYNIIALCAPGEDTTELRQLVLDNATTITQCFLKTMTCDEFANSNIDTVTTYFGATVSIDSYGSGSGVFVNLHEFGTNDYLLGELISDIVSVVSGAGIEALLIKGNYTSNGSVKYGTLFTYYFSDGYTDISFDGIIPAVSRAIDILDAKSSQNSGCGMGIVPIELAYAKTIYPNNIIKSLRKVSVVDEYKEQFYEYTGITELNIFKNYSSNYTYGLKNGIFTIGDVGDLSFVGTPINANISKVRVYPGAGDWYSLFAAALRMNVSNLFYPYQQNNECSVTGGVGIGFVQDNIDIDRFCEIVDAGLTRFDRVSEDIEIGLSLRHKKISVNAVTHGNMLICPFAGAGYFESGYDDEYINDGIVAGRYVSAISSIMLNGVSVTENNSVAQILAGAEGISVSSEYMVSSSDIQLIKTILNLLRDGYKTKFRHAVDESQIGQSENEYAYNLLRDILRSLFGEKLSDGSYSGVVDGYANLVRIAKGESISFIREFDNKSNGLVNISPVEYFVSTAGVGRGSRSIYFGLQGSSSGYLNVSSDNSDDIEFEQGDIEQAYQDSGNNIVSAIEHYEKNGDELVLYFSNTGLDDGRRFMYAVSVSINPKAMVSSMSDFYPVGRDDDGKFKIVFPDSWQTVAHADTRGVLVNSRAHVVYTPVANSDGSVTVQYQAFDENGNDITDQFNTLTLGETFIHKEVN